MSEARAAPAVLEACMGALARRPAALLTDLDGTISPIVPDPAAAFVLPGCREALDRLARRLDLVGVLSGRRPEQARELVGLDQLEYWGVHGALHLNREGVTMVPEAVPSLDQIARVALAAREWPRWEGVRIEDKGAAIAFHYRLAADPEEARRWLLARLAPIAAAGDLDLLEGRMVIELRAPGLGKGWTIQRLARDRGLAALIYLGDDHTDAEAFGAVAEWRAEAPSRRGVTVAVANPEAPAGFARRADFTLMGVTAVEALLSDLAAALEHVRVDAGQGEV